MHISRGALAGHSQGRAQSRQECRINVTRNIKSRPNQYASRCVRVPHAILCVLQRESVGSLKGD